MKKKTSLLCLVTLFTLVIHVAPAVSAGTRLQPAAQPGTPAGTLAAAASPESLWQLRGPEKRLADPPDISVRRGFREVFTLDEQLLADHLAGAPMEFATVEKAEDYRILLPMPDGTQQAFRIWESPIMEPGLAGQFPLIRTYVGQGIDDPAATTRFDVTPAGFRAIVLGSERTVYIDPYRRGDTENYLVYDKRGFRPGDKRPDCLVGTPEFPVPDAPESAPGFDDAGPAELTNAGTLRTYRLAMACTGEYAAFHGGTVDGAMAAITTTVNRVNAVYERDLSVRMVLVANNTTLIFTNASTDPYTNTNGSTMLSQNQSTVDSRIGNANYDIGHVVSTGGGGVAYLRSVCNNSNKAGGVTGSGSPVGDPFDIDYVAHEMGHQFGGNHTFNDCGSQRNASTAYEPGSGSTIQAYAGICGSTNIQNNSDDYFHSVSLNEMIAHVTGTANACSVRTTTGNSAPASVNAGPNYTIPVSTPFTLTGSATDPNGDALTYCWEEWDLGAATSTSTRPVFRSRRPTTSPSRTFPQMSDVLAGNNSTTWEATPSAARTLRFRLMVRDNRAGGGGVSDNWTGSTTATSTTDGFTVITVASGTSAFSVTSPNTAVSWAGNSTQTVSWNVGGTGSGTTVNCANVKISLSTNGGTSWTTVVESTPNDGSQAITVPNTPSTQCRVKVEAVGNVFFDVSNANFTITSGGTGTAPAAPSGLAASAASASQINLSWSDNSTNETGFKIERKTGTGGTYSEIATVGAGVTSYASTGLAASTTYVYRVRATNATGDSAYSNEASATTQSSGGGCTSSTSAIAAGTPANGSLATTDCQSTIRTGGRYYDDFTFTATAGTQYTITMTSTAFDTYLYLMSGTTQLAFDDDGNGGTNSRIVYTPTSSGTLTIHATSYAAGATGAYTVSLTGGSSGPATLLSEGAESGASGWTVSTNVTGNNWAVSSTARRTGSNGFRTANGTTYVNNLNQSLISPTFSLAGRTAATLSFYYKHDTESNYDWFYVEISKDGGSTWTSIMTRKSGVSSGFSATAGAGFAPQMSIAIPSAQLGSSNTKVRFRFTSDGSVTDWGVVVDDILVTAQ